MKKRKLKIKSILVLFLVIALITFFIISLFKKNNNTLEKIGYNKLEIVEIEKLSKDELEIIYNTSYNTNLVYMIKSDKYKSDKLNLYLKYTNTYKDTPYLKIMDLINNKDFKEDNIEKYIECLNYITDIEKVIKFINEDSTRKIDSTTLLLYSEKYYINDYLDRYLKYYENHKSLDYKEIITRINSNLDYEFYTDSNKSDLSKGMYTLVNKYNYLESNYVPDDLVTITGKYARDSAKLVSIAYENFTKMADDMSNLGMTIKITTGYRSYSFQSTLYNNYVKSDGVKKADTYSARPGYSEHQLGYSADLTNKQLVSFGEFENTKEYNWLKENAHKYGFILRYPKDKEYITGYQFESWHYRYVGVDIATYIYENDITYEEYYAYFLR